METGLLWLAWPTVLYSLGPGVYHPNESEDYLSNKEGSSPHGQWLLYSCKNESFMRHLRINSFASVRDFDGVEVFYVLHIDC